MLEQTVKINFGVSPSSNEKLKLVYDFVLNDLFLVPKQIVWSGFIGRLNKSSGKKLFCLGSLANWTLNLDLGLMDEKGKPIEKRVASIFKTSDVKKLTDILYKDQSLSLVILDLFSLDQIKAAINSSWKPKTIYNKWL